MTLNIVFTELCKRYTPDGSVIAVLWKKISDAYSAKTRHYHNLHHLEHLYEQLEYCSQKIADMDSVLFALFFHDFVYKSTAKDNEEKSAEACLKSLAQIGITGRQAEVVSRLILATKSHAVSDNMDINLFTDADLSILGSDPSNYVAYTRAIRKEYSIYPDLLYRPGRRKVVQHFMNMPRIFKTEEFYERLEKQARINLETELSQLN